jgi:hypothetical protein
MSREEAVNRVCGALRAAGETAAPALARRAGVARSVAYSVCDELLESGELVRRREGHIWLYRLVWQEEHGGIRTVLRLCRAYGIEARRDRWRDRLRIRAPHPMAGEHGHVWLDTKDDVRVYLVDREVAR